MKKKLILLVNVGTPDKPDVIHVGKYLLQFLNDRRVIDLPWLLQKILVNLIIVPFRVKKSTNLYKELWTDKGSPLSFYLINLVSKLQLKLKNEYIVMGAMRYGNPSLKHTLLKIKKEFFSEIIVIPLFPQYASSTTGSVQQFILNELSRWEIIPEIRFITQFYSHPSYIRVFANRIASYKPENFDMVIFSYHGLPVSQIQKVHQEVDYKLCDCENKIPEHGKYCYKANCFENSRLLSEKLKISPDKYITTFQSRFSKNWLTPFTDKELVRAAKEGKKRILVVAPSFVTDCLESIVEIDKTYRRLFEHLGGDELVMVESLNDSDEWVDSIIEIIEL